MVLAGACHPGLDLLRFGSRLSFDSQLQLLRQQLSEKPRMFAFLADNSEDECDSHEDVDDEYFSDDDLSQINHSLISLTLRLTLRLTPLDILASSPNRGQNLPCQDLSRPASISESSDESSRSDSHALAQTHAKCFTNLKQNLHGILSGGSILAGMFIDPRAPANSHSPESTTFGSKTFAQTSDHSSQETLQGAGSVHMDNVTVIAPAMSRGWIR